MSQSEFKGAANLPAAPTSEQQDDFHGTIVKDPFRPLEDLESPSTVAWTDAQTALFRDYISTHLRYDELVEKLTDAYDYPSSSIPSQYGDRLVRSHNPGLNPQSWIQVQDNLDSEPEIVINPNEWSEDGTAALSGMSISPDGKYMAYFRSDNGSDAQTMRILNLETGEELPEVFENLRFCSVQWLDNPDDGFYYNFPVDAPDCPPEKQTKHFSLKYHKLGTDPKDDPVIFDTPAIAEGIMTRASMFIPRHSEHEWLEITVGTNRTNGLFYRPKGSDKSFTKLFGALDNAYDIIAEIDGQVYMKTDHDAPKGKLVRFSLDNPAPENWDTIIKEPTGDHELFEYAFIHLDKLYVGRSVDLSDQIDICDLDGQKHDEIPIPEFSQLFFGRFNKNSDTGYVRISDPTQPGAIYRYDFDANTLDLVEESNAKLTLDNAEVERIYATSKDGTQVPMFVIKPKDVELDGTAAVKLYGYGGFNIPLAPTYTFSRASWVSEGGIYVIANLRGGGEFGRDWAEAGKKANKQNVFDDFIACANHLAQEGYADPSRIVSEGGSNGGLLTLATMLQSPESFGAVISQVPVADMLRFMDDGGSYGGAWVSDYGNPKESAEDFQISMAYSPLHNVEDGGKYPPLAVFTGDHDDRVKPWHAFKYFATHQSVSDPENVAFLRVEKNAGHGAGKSTEKIIREMVDGIAFVEQTIGPIHQPSYKMQMQQAPEQDNSPDA